MWVNYSHACDQNRWDKWVAKSTKSLSFQKREQWYSKRNSFEKQYVKSLRNLEIEPKKMNQTTTNPLPCKAT